MLPDPLHPAIVHFPIVLSLLLPLVALSAILVIRRRASPRPVWSVVVVVATLLAASSWLAVQTGESDEELVEEAVAEQPVERHEEDGERLLILSGLLAVVILTGLVTGRYGVFFRYAGLAAAVLVAASGIATGRSGGALIYEHNAARVYSQGGSLAGDNGGRVDDRNGEDEREEHEDDDDDDDDD
jgi:uncharacterized membrane protein